MLHLNSAHSLLFPVYDIISLPLIQYVPTNNATDNTSIVLQVVNRTFDVVNSMNYSAEDFVVSNGNQLTKNIRSLELDECYQLVLMEVELNQTTELYRQKFSESFQLLSPCIYMYTTCISNE